VPCSHDLLHLTSSDGSEPALEPLSKDRVTVYS
jgi:hypothetical protein